MFFGLFLKLIQHVSGSIKVSVSSLRMSSLNFSCIGFSPSLPFSSPDSGWRLWQTHIWKCLYLYLCLVLFLHSYLVLYLYFIRICAHNSHFWWEISGFSNINDDHNGSKTQTVCSIWITALAEKQNSNASLIINRHH